MKRKTCKRMISVLLSAIIVITMLVIAPISASAASRNWAMKIKNTSTTVNNAATADYTNVSYTNSSRTFSAAATAIGTVSIKNNTDTYEATFRVSVTAGSIDFPDVVGVTKWTEDDYIWFTVKPGKTAEMTLNPKKNAKSTIVMNSSYCWLTELAADNKSFKAAGAAHGKLTLSGVGDSDVVLNSASDTYDGQLAYGTQITLTAQPDAGYTFYGFCNGSTWYGGGDSKTLTLDLQEDSEYTVFFYKESDPMFRVGVRRFTVLNEANAYAAASETDKTIILERSGSISGTNSVSAGVSLVIPSADVTEGVWTEPNPTTGSYVTPTPFRTLTLEPGAVLDVDGVISVNGTLKLAQETRSGPTGTVGEIYMGTGSVINLNGSATMYTWGYVYGDGDVYANGTSSVYEEMCINDLRGGRATLDLYELNQNNGFGCFPFEQYYVQNIESRLHLCSTATEYITAGLNISAIFVRTAPFIGSQGVFRLADGSTLTKYYDSVNDKLVVEVDGDAQLNKLAISLTVDPSAEGGDSGSSGGSGGFEMNFTIDSSEFILPINNMWIRQKSGLLTTHYKINLLPDSGMIIDPGASVLVSDDSEVYIYDVDDLGAYNPKGNLVPLSYSPTLGRASTRSYSNMVDSFVEVNGTLEIVGKLNTTQNGANITSSNPNTGSGSYGKVIVHNKDVGEFWGAYQDSNRIAGYDPVPLTPPVLKNSNDTYRTTVARNNMDAEFYYVDLPNIKDKDGNALSVWVSSEDPDYFNVVWVDRDGNTLQTKRVKNTELAIAEYTGEDIPSYTEESGGVVTKFCDFIGWESEYDVASATLTYKPRFKEVEPITITWKSGSSVITRTYIRKLDKLKTSDIPVEAINNWSIANLTTETTYSRYNGFTGTIQVAGGTLTDYSSSNMGYRLGYDTTLNVTWATVTTAELYNVTWQNETGGTILTKQYFSTQNPVFDGVEPVSSDSSKEFYGWKLGTTTYEKSATLPKPTADQTYTPVFNQKIKVTWKNFDGSEIAAAYYPQNTSVANVVYSGATPARAADAQYTYKFTGWNKPASGTLTADVAYTAQYKTFLNSYTVTWNDEDDTTLETDTFFYGAIPECAVVPTKAPDESYTYTFRGWTPAVTAVTGEITYTADYTATPVGEDPYRFISRSITLDGKIGVTFYFTMPVFNNEKMRFTFKDTTETVDIANSTNEEGLYSATKYVNAPEMSDVILAELLTADGATVLADRIESVASYINAYEGSQSYESFYIVGTIMGRDLWPNNGNWDAQAQATYRMYNDLGNTTQYVLNNVELLAGDEIKVYNNGAYYGNTSGNNYHIDEDGVYTVYCYPQSGTYYLSLVKATASDKIITALLRAMDRYGNLAMDYFADENVVVDIEDHIDRIPKYPGIDSAALTARIGENAENIKTVDFSSTGLKYYGTSLLLDSGTVMRHYFHVDNEALFDAAKDNVYFGGYKVEAHVYEGGAPNYVYFDLEIPAAELDEAKVISIDGVEAHFSALDYIKRSLVKYEEDTTNEDNAKLAELMTSLYWYNFYADMYFNA